MKIGDKLRPQREYRVYGISQPHAMDEYLKDVQVRDRRHHMHIKSWHLLACITLIICYYVTWRVEG